MEWALEPNPTQAIALSAVASASGATFEYRYTRSLAAVNAGVSYICGVERCAAGDLLEQSRSDRRSFSD